MGLSLYTMIIGTASGMGKRIIDSQLVYNTGEMYATIIILEILGYVLNYLLLIVERKAIHWTGKD